MNFELLETLLPLALALGLAMAVPAAMMILSAILGPKNGNPSKLSTYECGIQPEAVSGDARHHFDVKFYLIAMCLSLIHI